MIEDQGNNKQKQLKSMDNSWLNLMTFNINRNRISLGEQKKKDLMNLLSMTILEIINIR